MSYVIAAPEMMTSAAADLAAIGANVNAAHMVATAPTVAVVPAAADEVSASIAHLFSQHAANYQAMAGRAAAFQEQVAQHLTASAASFAHAEAANTALLQPLTASAASIGSTIGAVPGQLLNLVNAAVGQLLNDFTGFVDQILIPVLIPEIVVAGILYCAFLVLVSVYFPNLLPLFPNPFLGLGQIFFPFGFA
jgi:hypothetical protein